MSTHVRSSICDTEFESLIVRRQIKVPAKYKCFYSNSLHAVYFNAFVSKLIKTKSGSLSECLSALICS